MATTYGLLQLPKMPELKHQDISQFPKLENFDVNKIPFKNRQQESARLQKLEMFKETGVWPGHNKHKVVHRTKTQPWSKTKEHKEVKRERKLKRKRKKEELETSGNVPVKKAKRRKNGQYISRLFSSFFLFDTNFAFYSVVLQG